MPRSQSVPRTCPVCGSPVHQLAVLCKRCKKLVDRVDIRRKPDKQSRVKALRDAWNGKGFTCHYTGILLVEDNPGDPRYLTFDHRTPRDESDIVVTAALVNDMKSDMSDEEFRTVVSQLARRFGGGVFDESVFALKHWKR
jgi:5-methylcytosine-specific restriction endonuclease McrA